MAKTREDAAVTYKFVRADLIRGMDYGVVAELYNDCMQAIGSTKRVTEDVTSQKFADDFWSEWVRFNSIRRL